MPRTPLDAITNYLELTPLVGTAGQPTAEQFSLLAAAGYKVVINLATPTSTDALPNEAELVAQHGMVYVPIPVAWEHPTTEDVYKFFAALDAYQGQRIFVHCVLNYRVSVFMYLHSVLREDILPEEAIWDVRAIWEPDDVWDEFMSSMTEEP